MFEYTLASDLHMDTGHHGPRLSGMDWGVGPILIAGDLGNGLGNFKFVDKLRRAGRSVFMTDGNHEHYANATSGRTAAETEARFDDLRGHTSVVPLGDGLYLITCNGWYQVEDEDRWRYSMSDARHGALTANTVNDMARCHADFVGEQLVKLPHDAKAIVMTHTAPCEASLDPKFAGSETNPYYWNPMMEHVLVTCASSIAVWHHGHTHAAVDVRQAGVRILTNPRGYPGENPEWRPLQCSL